jgi:hypothetical protein
MRINRQWFPETKVLDLLRDKAISAEEALRLLEEACHALKRERERIADLKIGLRSMINYFEE